MIPFKVVDVGGNVTLHCPVSNTGGKFFHWYKQPLGHMMQTVASASIAGLKLTEQFNNSRFKLAAGASQYSLTIKNISKEDEAAYLCQNGTAYFQSFAAGIYLAVNGKLCYVKSNRSFEVRRVSIYGVATILFLLLPYFDFLTILGLRSNALYID
uniref:Ig-like domain-containing protein n=1 Tax=Fundulus heteroclitus TaxID=8078 RepID=A0A3Q2T5E0_FUNHE